MLKFLLSKKPVQSRLERAVEHSRIQQQQIAIRSRASRIIAEQQAKSLARKEEH